jgi:hypothetical protein
LLYRPVNWPRFEILFDDIAHPTRWDLWGLFINCNEGERLLLYRPVSWSRFELLFDDGVPPGRLDLRGYTLNL